MSWMVCGYLVMGVLLWGSFPRGVPSGQQGLYFPWKISRIYHCRVLVVSGGKGSFSRRR